MHPASPIVHLVGEFGLASLPHSPASPVHEAIQIEETDSSPPRCVGDDGDVLSSHRRQPSLLSLPACAQPLSAVLRIDSLDMLANAPRDCQLACFGAGGGQTDKLSGQQVASPAIYCCFDLPKPSKNAFSRSLDDLPTEILLHVLGFLDVGDLLATSRTNHVLRRVSLAPILQHYRLQRTREVLTHLLWSPARSTVADLRTRSIFITPNTDVSRRLARSLVSIRLSRRLALRPPAADLVEKCVLPRECVPGMSSVHVSPVLVAKRRAIEKERVKDGLRRWIGGKWKGQVREREQELRRWHESRGIGRVWKLTRFWERVSRGDALPLSLSGPRRA